MPRAINDLSTEILRHMLRHVKSNSRKDRDATFLNTLTVCRLWYEIGHDLLWTDVSLTGGQLVKFTRHSHPSSTLIRSLTIKVPSYRDQKIARVDFDETATIYPPYCSPQISMALDLLPKNLSIMKKLESFSLVMPCAHGGMPYTEIHPVSLLRILIELPQSLRHLELDTNRLEATCMDETVHLCPLFPALMGRLSNLRLRLASVCKEIFSQDTAEFTDRGHDPNFGKRTQKTILISAVHCGGFYPFRPYLGETRNRSCFQRYTQGNDMFQDVIASAKNAIQRRKCRESLRLSFFQLTIPRRKDGFEFETINERTLLPRQGVRKFLFQRGTKETRSFLRYQDANRYPKDLAGSFKDLESVAEGRIWVETVEGYQIPYEYYRSESRFSTSSLKELAVLDLDQAITDSYGSLFRMEHREGHKLVTVEESSDLQDVSAVRRDLTREEMQYKAELEAREQPPPSPLIERFLIYKFRDVPRINIPAPPITTNIGDGSDPDQDFDGNPLCRPGIAPIRNGTG